MNDLIDHCLLETAGQGVLRQMLGITDVVGALILLWCTQKITSGAGFTTARARCALLARFTYFTAALAFFILGAERLGNVPEGTIGYLSHFVELLALMVFPVIRAAKIVGWPSWGLPHSPRHHRPEQG